MRDDTYLCEFIIYRNSENEENVMINWSKNENIVIKYKLDSYIYIIYL